jgi:hypothetical protein
MGEYSDADKENWPSDTYDYSYDSSYGVSEERWWDMKWSARRDFLDKWQTTQKDNAMLDSLFANEVQFTPISESDIRKTLIDPLTGVISDERLSQLMPDWKQDAMTAVNWNEQQFSKVLDMAYGQATKDASILNEFNRVEADKMNKFMAEQFYSAMDEGTPGLRSLTGKYQGTVSDMLSGELPISVKQQLEQESAERGMSRGLFGEASSNLGLRDLGLTSLDYIQRGQEQMPTMMGVAEAMRAPQIQMSLADAGALGSQYGSALLGLTTMSPTAAVSAGAQQAQLGIGLETFNQQMLRSNQELNVNRTADWLRFNSSQGMAAQQFNAQMNYAAALSNLNYSLDQQAFEWNYKTAQMQAKSAEDASMWGALGSIGGAVVGAAGGAVGAWLGDG